MLATSLKEMEADGMVLRTQYDEMPVRVEYRLTDKAKSIIPILLELKKWGEQNMNINGGYQYDPRSKNKRS